MPRSEMSLCTGLDKVQIMLGTDLNDPCHIRRLPIQMNRDYRSRPPGYRTFNLLNINKIVIVHIHEYRPGPGLGNCL